MKAKRFIIVILFSTLFNFTFGFNEGGNETTKPEVGKPMPDFVLNKITHWSLKKASLKDFRGKWLILDFWSTGCLSCIYSFPKVNSLNKEFSAKLNWILVGIHSYAGNTEVFYEKYRKRKGLDVPSAYDSALAFRWGIHAVPQILIVDPDGIVRYITDGSDLTRGKIIDMLAGKPVDLRDTSEKEDLKADPPAAPVVSIPEANVFYRSQVSEWNGEKASWGTEIDRWVKWGEKELKKGFTFNMIPLYSLYMYAHMGKLFIDYDDPMYNVTYPLPLIESPDSSMFRLDKTGKHSFNYSLVLPYPKISRENVMTHMQSDLLVAFGHKAAFETREMPVWKLVAKPGAIDKLKTKGGKKFATDSLQIFGFEVRNQEHYNLIGLVTFYMYKDPLIPFVDETGLNENFDLTLDADMTEMENVRKAINKQGLDLVRGTKKMQVLVIRKE